MLLFKTCHVGHLEHNVMIKIFFSYLSITKKIIKICVSSLIDVVENMLNNYDHFSIKSEL